MQYVISQSRCYIETKMPSAVGMDTGGVRVAEKMRNSPRQVQQQPVPTDRHRQAGLRSHLKAVVGTAVLLRWKHRTVEGWTEPKLGFAGSRREIRNKLRAYSRELLT